MRLKILLVTLTFILAGCQTIVDTGKLTTEAIVANEIVESGAPFKIMRSANLSEHEREVIDQAAIYYRWFRVTYWGAIKDPLGSNVSIESFNNHYSELVRHYLLLEDVTKRNKEDYSKPQLAQLTGYRHRALSINKKVKGLVSIGRKREAMANAIDFGLVMMRMVAL